jgi:alkylation response protein AidB-like acyl-CoA dehydrogenase
MQLAFDADVEAFRAEFVAFLDEHLPDEAETVQRSHSSSDVPLWARRWQRRLFDHGWLLPGNPPEFGGRNATVLQQYVHAEELSRRRIYQSFNPQGVGIIAASILSFGTSEQKQRWAVPILRAEMTASLGMSEPGAGSDLASLRTRAVRGSDSQGDHFVVDGQKVWTSGAHDADVLLTFVRTDPDAPKHKGISVLLIPTDSPGVRRRPFESASDREDLDFNEVFFTDVRVPVENLVGPLNLGWRVATGSLGHEHHALDGLFRPIAGIDCRFPALRGTGARSLRHVGHGLRGAAAAWFGGPGACRPWRRGCAEPVGAEAAGVGSGADRDRTRAERRRNRRACPPRHHRPLRAVELGFPLRQLV